MTPIEQLLQEIWEHDSRWMIYKDKDCGVIMELYTNAENQIIVRGDTVEEVVRKVWDSLYGSHV